MRSGRREELLHARTLFSRQGVWSSAQCLKLALHRHHFHRLGYNTLVDWVHVLVRSLYMHSEYDPVNRSVHWSVGTLPSGCEPKGTRIELLILIIALPLWSLEPRLPRKHSGRQTAALITLSIATTTVIIISTLALTTGSACSSSTEASIQLCLRETALLSLPRRTSIILVARALAGSSGRWTRTRSSGSPTEPRRNLGGSETARLRTLTTTPTLITVITLALGLTHTRRFRGGLVGFTLRTLFFTLSNSLGLAGCSGGTHEAHHLSVPGRTFARRAPRGLTSVPLGESASVGWHRVVCARFYSGTQKKGDG